MVHTLENKMKIIHWSDIKNPISRAIAKLTWDELAWQNQCDEEEYETEQAELVWDYSHLRELLGENNASKKS